MPSCFPSDASLVLIGMRCAGKSSLASIAAKSLHWKVVDEKFEFQNATGKSMGEYISEHGVKAYYACEELILKSILEENQRSRIIVLSSSCIEVQAGRDLLRQYLSIVPIVHVMRDGVVLQSHLASKWTGDVAKILRSQEPVYLACSNFTFFNTDDAVATTSRESTPPNRMLEAVTSPSDRPTSRLLSLKRVESDFLRFLGSIYGCRTGANAIDDPNAIRYALHLPPGNLKAASIKLESFTCTADMIQFRTDTLLQEYYTSDKPNQMWWECLIDQLAYLRRQTDQPILYHAVVPECNPADTGPEYSDLIFVGLRVGAEFITVDLTQEESLLGSVAQQKGNCKLVGWLHDRDPGRSGGWTSQGRLFYYDKAVAVGCDMVHITQSAVMAEDNALAQWYAQTMTLKGPLQVSAYNTGRLGRPSQCFNKGVTLVRHDSMKTTELDMVSIPQAQAALFASLSCEPLSFSVMGTTVCYSLAPIVHSSAFDVYGMPHRYSINQTDNLDLIDDLAHDDHFGGVGLTAPFKTSIISKLRCMSTEARAIGAVNTVMAIRQWDDSGSPFESILPRQRNRGGKVLGLYGENLDWKGIKTCALRYLSPVNAITPLSTALIIGAGGMARAAIYAMIRSGIKNICIYNRTYQHAVDLVEHFHSQTDGRDGLTPTISSLQSLDDPWPSNLRFPTVIVNCSPIPGDKITLNHPSSYNGSSVGAKPAVSIPDAWLQSPTGGVYMELAYNSLTSSPELVRIACDDKGWVGVAGLEIFLEVASAQFEFWTGRRAPQHYMKEGLGRHLQRMQEDSSA
ncbi:hypothetical protein ACHAPJ_006617 [Fusarium lateritium]